jgi:hypothetical protein
LDGDVEHQSSPPFNVIGDSAECRLFKTLFLNLEHQTMIIHTVAFQWKAAATAEHQQRVLKEIRAFQGQIPGLLETHAGFNFSPNARGYALAATMKLADRAALAAYMAHPIHQQLIEWLLPLVEPIEIDFEV